MLGILKRYLRRRKLVGVVGALPRQLTKSFGGQDKYTVAQVNRAAEKLGLKAEVRPFALAACCA